MKCDFCSEESVDLSIIIEDEETGKTTGDGKYRCESHYHKWLDSTARNRNRHLRNHPEEVEPEPKKWRKDNSSLFRRYDDE